MDASPWPAARRGLAAFALGVLLGSGPAARAADRPDGVDGPLLPTAPRFFPRSDGPDSPGHSRVARLRGLAECAPRRAAVPTDAPDDPSYVGSPYGLGKPSYYGFRPALGHDDPFGRPLRYCP